MEIEHGKVKHTFVPFARRTLHEITCDLSDCQSPLEAENRLLASTERIPASDLVKAILVGDCPPQLMIDTAQLSQLLSQRFYFAKLVNRTRLAIRPQDYIHDVSLKGEFVRRVMASDLTEAEKEEIIICGFRALNGEELNA